jgi:glyoxylase-like metal-dependent hydrolase (beta-lactamase superfamily II)
MQKLAKDIYVESGFTGVTVGAVVTSEGIVCIDTPTGPADARRWRLKLAQLTDKPVRFIINLDHHRDRVLGNPWFEAPVIAHELTYERVKLYPEMFKGGLSEVGADTDLIPDLAGVRLIAPQITFANRMALTLGGHEIHIVHRPGVAAGAAWVELPAPQIIFTGDAVTNGAPPFMQDADLGVWLETLAEMQKKKFPAKTIVPGRGSPTDKAGVKVTEDFLKLARRKVESLVRAKKTRSEAAVLAEDLLEEFSVTHALREHYTRRLRAGLEHVFDTLTAPPKR